MIISFHHCSLLFVLCNGLNGRNLRMNKKEGLFFASGQRGRLKPNMQHDVQDGYCICERRPFYQELSFKCNTRPGPPLHFQTGGLPFGSAMMNDLRHAVHIEFIARLYHGEAL